MCLALRIYLPYSRARKQVVDAEKGELLCDTLHRAEEAFLLQFRVSTTEVLHVYRDRGVLFSNLRCVRTVMRASCYSYVRELGYV